MFTIDFLKSVNWFILCYLTVATSIYVFLLMATIVDVFNKFFELQEGNIKYLTRMANLPPVSILIPTYNEEENVMETLNSILNSDYPNKQLVIINDGSTDKTLEILIEKLQLHSVTPIIKKTIPIIGEVTEQYISKLHQNIVVISKKNGGTSDALNVGINASRAPMLMTIDADTLIEPKAISQLVFDMLSKAHTVAVGGSVYILNGCVHKDGEILDQRMPSTFVGAIQVPEYLRSFLFGRTGWIFFGGALCHAGAITLLEHNAALEIGGYQNGNKAQDFEIITHLHHNRLENHFPYRINYMPSAAVWTDVPSTFKEYWQQRTNWQQGTLKSLMSHKIMLFNPLYGAVGLFTYPFYLFFEVLGCMVEFVGYISVFMGWYIGILDLSVLLLFFVLCWGILAFLTMASVLMNVATYNKYKRTSYLFWILFFSIFQIFGFRQFDITCRVVATLKYFWVYLKDSSNKIFKSLSKKESQ